MKKILVANRGEISIRIQRTCREMGLESVAVHSTVDEPSLHVKMADESVCIGPASPKLSYLNIPSILSAAEITNADALHPGYGFLAENAEFARMCAEWNVTFIGPNPEAIELMGDKIRSKKIAQEANVPVLETLEAKLLSKEELEKECERLTFPVLIKASAGGGGKGMRKVFSKDQLLTSLATVQSEAKASFGDDTVFVEKFIENPRHIEVQVVADKHGNYFSLGERDCTVQRRYQKLIEESPSPVLTEKLREEVCAYAISLAKRVGYDSVGTVEFLYDQDAKKFYFMEMNTRIQVEHPVTEFCFGVDLIRLQILAAQGENLKDHLKHELISKGHSLECRINAEDPKTFRPSPGKVEHYHRPGGPGVRADDFIYTGYTILPFYDSMISKVIVYGRDREECLVRMKRALKELVIEGVVTNRALYFDILNHPAFISGEFSTNFLEKHLFPSLS